MSRIQLMTTACLLVLSLSAGAQTSGAQGPLDPSEGPSSSPWEGGVAFGAWLRSVDNPGETIDLLLQHLPAGWVPAEQGLVTPQGEFDMVGFALHDESLTGEPLVGSMSLGVWDGRVGMIDVRSTQHVGDQLVSNHRIGVRGADGGLDVTATYDSAGGLVTLEAEEVGYGAILGNFQGFKCVRECVFTLFGLTGPVCPVLGFHCGGSPISFCQFSYIKCLLTPNQTAAVFACVGASCFM